MMRTLNRQQKRRRHTFFQPRMESLERREVFSGTFTGPSSSATPYVIPSNPGIEITSLMTVGDSVNAKPDGVTTYQMVGIPDGLGAFDNADGTFTLLMNHEIPVNIPGGTTTASPLGGIRAHGNAGAFVSEWIINKSDLSIVQVKDFLADNLSLCLSNNNPSSGTVHTGYLVGDTTLISRLCSADLGAATSHIWTDPVTHITYGTDALLFESGEESGGIVNAFTAGFSGDLGPEDNVHFGRQFAFVATDDTSIPGNQANTAYELPHHGLFPWENNLVNPLSQRKTIVVGTDDTTPGQVYVWVGDKQTIGNVVERAGLTRQSANDNLYVIRVAGLTPDASGATNEDRNTPLNGTFTLENEGDVSGLTAAGLESLSDSKGGTQFLRPEDGHWDPSNPSDFYFVTTDRYDQVKDGVGTQVGRSRLYRLHFTDIAHPELGGTIECLLDGTEAGNMFDNMTVDSQGRVLLQEDVGGQAHSGKIWLYDIASGALLQLAQHDPARFGDIGVPATAPFNNDEESSGIIDVSHILGNGSYLLDVQAHYGIAGELVEGGQLLLMKVGATAGLGYDTQNGNARALVVLGTSHGDDITITQDGTNYTVTVDSQVLLSSFAAPSATRVIANGYQGEDVIDAFDLATSAALYGGNGKDVLIGGADDDLLDGGNGKDELTGNAGGDVFCYDADSELLDFLDGTDVKKKRK